MTFLPARARRGPFLTPETLRAEIKKELEFVRQLPTRPLDVTLDVTDERMLTARVALSPKAADGALFFSQLRDMRSFFGDDVNLEARAGRARNSGMRARAHVSSLPSLSSFSRGAA